MSDDGPPESILRAVKMLNNPWDYEAEFDLILDGCNRQRSVREVSYQAKSDPSHRISAKAEQLGVSADWVLYVEWDDSEPNSARSIVHKVIRICGLESYVASGSSGNLDFDAEVKFPVRSPDVSYLKVAPTGSSVRYVCEECETASGDVGEGSVDLRFSVE